MIFVNTSLDTAIKRNAERPRKLPNSVVTQSWNDVQKNIGKFSQYFRQNFMVVDNNDSKEDVMTPVYKQIMSLAKKKVNNPIAKRWIANELEMKKDSGGAGVLGKGRGGGRRQTIDPEKAAEIKKTIFVKDKVINYIINLPK